MGNTFGKLSVTWCYRQVNMTFEEIEKLIVQNGEIPKQMNERDRNCWYALRGLYLSFKGRQIDRALAKKQKAEIAESFRRMNALHSQYTAGLAGYQEDIRKAGELRAGLCKAENEHEALDIALQVISRMTGEDITEKTVRERLKGKP